MNEEIIATLEAARSRLFEKGWMQGGIGRPEGPNCLWGAIRYSLGNEALVSDLIQLLNGVIGLPRYAIGGFNDKESTTFGDVIEVIDKAILVTKEKL